ncbi:MAG: VanZ family protein [Ruminococcus sp.]
MSLWFYSLPWSGLLWVMPAAAILYFIIDTALREFKLTKALKILCSSLLILWCGYVLYSTVFSREAAGQRHSFQPLFASYEVAKELPEMYRSNFTNILLYFPSGLLLFSLLSDNKKPLAFIIAVILPCLLSAGIEVSQYFFSLGYAEADDIMHNTLGALFGAGTGLLTAFVFPYADRLICRLKGSIFSKR